MQNYSVAICTFNGRKYIVEQLKSIVEQTIPPSQIIISDDGSIDGTLDIVADYLKSTPIDYEVVVNRGPHGVTSNFQNAFSHCKCPIIFTSDQDDVWMPDKAEKMLTVYDNDCNAMLVFSNGELVDCNLNLLGCTIWKAVGISPKRIAEGNWFKYLLKNCLVTGAEMSFRKSLLDDINRIPEEWLHDGWLTWAAVIRNGLRTCPYSLILYRQHDSNVVGMTPSSALRGKIKNWVSNFDEVKELRRIRYKRYLSLQNMWGYKFSDSQQKALAECIDMWKTLYSSNNARLFRQIRNTMYCLINGYYHKYYVGFRGFVRDFILSFMPGKNNSFSN